MAINTSAGEVELLLSQHRTAPSSSLDFQRPGEAWNVATNLRSLFGVNSRSGVLDGVRALSLLWVIVIHSYTFYPNRTEALNDSFWTRWMQNGVYGVDAFFVLSGFLIYHILSKEQRKNEGRFRLWRFYLRRWLRLMPAYAFVLAVFWAIFAITSLDPQQGQNCNRWGWTNFLFVNNFIPDPMQCMDWSWTIAIEMQFYFISPAIMHLLYRHPSLGRKMLWGGVGLCTFIRVVTSVVLLLLGRSDLWISLVYLTPWCRIAPYLTGMLTATYIEEAEADAERVDPPPLRRWLYFSIVALILLATGGVWSSHNNNDPLWSYGTCVMLGPVVLGLCVAYLIYDLSVYASDDSWLRWFLSARPFSVLAQLSYGIYLIAPVYQWSVYDAFADQLPELTILTFLCIWLGFVAISTLTAIGLHLLVEKPFMNIVK